MEAKLLLMVIGGEIIADGSDKSKIIVDWNDGGDGGEIDT